MHAVCADATHPVRGRLPVVGGTYILVLNMPRDATVKVGRLGEVGFSCGWYLYVGSALRGLRVRLERHLRSAKRRHWHIDYILDVAELHEIWYAVGRERRECTWAAVLRAQDDVMPTREAIGASDCACHTHFFRVHGRPDTDTFPPRLPGEVLVWRTMTGPVAQSVP